MNSKTLIINDKEIKGVSIAFDGCHKIYICESEADKLEAKKMGYNIRAFGARELSKIWENSCPLRFVSTWKLQNIVQQFDELEIKGGVL